eukprot:42056_1
MDPTSMFSRKTVLYGFVGVSLLISTFPRFVNASLMPPEPLDSKVPESTVTTLDGNVAFNQKTRRDYLVDGYVRSHEQSYGVVLPGDLVDTIKDYTLPAKRWDLVPFKGLHRWYFDNMSVTERFNGELHIKFDYRMFNVAKVLDPKFNGISVSLDLLTPVGSDRYDTTPVEEKYISVKGPHIDVVIPASARIASDVYVGFNFDLKHIRSSDLSKSDLETKGWYRQRSYCHIEGWIFKRNATDPQERQSLVNVRHTSNQYCGTGGIKMFRESSNPDGDFFVLSQDFWSSEEMTNWTKGEFFEEHEDDLDRVYVSVNQKTRRDYLVDGYVRSHEQSYGVVLPGDLVDTIKDYTLPAKRWDLVPFKGLHRAIEYRTKASVELSSSMTKMRRCSRLLEMEI